MKSRGAVSASMEAACEMNEALDVLWDCSEWPTILKQEIKNIAKDIILDDCLLLEIDQTIDGIFAIKAELEVHHPHMNLSKHHLNFTCFLNDVYSCVIDNNTQRFKILLNGILERHQGYAQGE